MKKILAPDYNFYTLSNLNRKTEKRHDEEWLSKKLHDGNSKIIFLRDLKSLVVHGENIKPLFLPAKDVNSNFELHRFILLGERGDAAYFCLNLNDREAASIALNKYGSFEDLRSIAPMLNREDAAILAFSRAMAIWHSTHKYCGVCGCKTNIKEAGYKIVCSNAQCKKEHFPQIDPAIIVLVSKDEKCLLARQAKWPSGRYSTIAGYVEPGESLEQAVQREVKEETNINVVNVEYHSSQPWPFPSAIMLGFRAVAVNDDIFLRDNELEKAQWFSREEIIEKLKDKSFGLSPSVSISFQLIKSWFNEESEIDLEGIIRTLK